MDIKLLPAREYNLVTKENRTKEILAWGGRVWKNKIHPAREYDVMIMEID